MSINTSELLKEIKFLAKKRNYREASVKMEEYLSLNPNDNYSLVYYVMLLNKIGNYRKSKALADKLLNEEALLDNKTRLFLYTQYAHLMANMKKYDSAVRFFNLVVDNSERDELEARSELARIYFSQKRISKCFEILTLENKKSKFLSLKKAIYLNRLHKYKEAIDEINSNKDLSWDKYYGFNEDFLTQEENYFLGNCYMQLKEDKTALEYLSKACNIKNSRTYCRAYYDIAYIKNRENKNNEAIEILKRLLEDSTANFMKYNIHAELGKSYLKKGDIENAEKHFNLSSDEYGQKSFLLSKLECSKGNFKKAEEYINQSKEKTSFVFPEMYYYDTLINFRNKNYDKAYDLIKNVENAYFGCIFRYSIAHLLSDLHLTELLIDRELGRQDISKCNTYMEKQIADYSMDEAVKHIKKTYFDETRIAYYKPSANIDSLIVEAKEKLNSDSLFCDSSFDKYIIPCDKVGIDNNGSTINQLLVVTLPNSKDIIEMYPVDASDNLRFTKLGSENSQPKKVYRMSQIDKFNAKYGDRF